LTKVPDLRSIGGDEINSKTDGCRYEQAKYVEISGLLFDVACFGKLWARGHGR
jgi:hypothetical protein